MKRSEKIGVIWNVLGGMMNAGASVVLFFCVTRLCGTEEAGLFAVIFATAQMLMEVGCHGVRGYQISDINERYTFREYEVNRFISCTVMMLGIFLVILLKGYQSNAAFLMALIGIFKMIDALADVYEGRLQQQQNLLACGKSLFIRTFSCVLIFALCTFWSRNIIWSSFLMAGIAILLFWILAYLPARKTLSGTYVFTVRHVMEIFKESFPLFISLLLLALIANIPKYAIEEKLTYEAQAIYNIIFLPAQVTYLLVIYTFKPFITKMSIVYCRAQSKFRKYAMELIVLTVLICGGFLLLANFGGIPVLQLLYGISLDGYKTELLVIVAGGGINALVGLLYYFLTIMRKQQANMIAYVFGTVGALAYSSFLVEKHEILGASLCYGISNAITMLIMIVAVFANKKSKETK